MTFKTLLLATALCVFFQGALNAAEDSSPPVRDANTISIVVDGKVPGFKQADLTAFLTQRLQGEAPAPWRFAAGDSSASSAPNRIVWRMTVIHETHKDGHTMPETHETYLRAEVKLYLKGLYQMTVDTHPTIQSGPDDKALDKMVHDVAQAIFVANASGAQ